MLVLGQWTPGQPSLYPDLDLGEAGGRGRKRRKRGGVHLLVVLVLILIAPPGSTTTSALHRRAIVQGAACTTWCHGASRASCRRGLPASHTHDKHTRSSHVARLQLNHTTLATHHRVRPVPSVPPCLSCFAPLLSAAAYPSHRPLWALSRKSSHAMPARRPSCRSSRPTPTNNANGTEKRNRGPAFLCALQLSGGSAARRGQSRPPPPARRPPARPGGTCTQSPAHTRTLRDGALVSRPSCACAPPCKPPAPAPPTRTWMVPRQKGHLAAALLPASGRTS